MLKWIRSTWISPIMKAYDSVWECKKSIGEFMEKYNARRLHQSLGEYDTPLEAYRQMQMAMAC